MFLNKKLIDRFFEIGIWGKFLIGIFEFLAGVIYWISGPVILNQFIIFLAQQEVAEDPNDVVVIYLAKMAGALSVGTHIFAIVYLIFHGAINIFLVVALAQNKTWAYHSALTGFSAFIVYQFYRYSYNHSLLLLFLTFFDIFIVTMIFLEYRGKRKVKPVKA